MNINFETMQKEELIEEFLHNMIACDGCNGCEEGCAVCGQWATHVQPEKENPEEYAEAEKRFKRYLEFKKEFESPITSYFALAAELDAAVEAEYEDEFGMDIPF